jgi:hypothetical protein
MDSWREDDARHEAEQELRLEAEYEAHEQHVAMGDGAEDAECWLCVQAAEEA